ncbi:MAG: hypothetical protein DMD44_11340 [Gemmatimonadetes bacterium]|nr:MAG: hypothetical protein DMD44_11340 [Gemmatimonadota bacterium]
MEQARSTHLPRRAGHVGSRPGACLDGGGQLRGGHSRRRGARHAHLLARSAGTSVAPAGGGRGGGGAGPHRPHRPLRGRRKGARLKVHGLILAGGEGSRLAAGGIAVPKPLVEVAGRPQIVGLLETFAALGCSSLTCAVRADFPAVRRLLDGRRFGPPLTVVTCRTPSSLHTLVEGLRGMAGGPVFCSMVDTVMRPEDWNAVYGAAGRYLEEGAELVLAVTPYVDDESPVYVSRRGDGDVRAVSDEPVAPVCVTGGAYGLSAAARLAAADAVARGVHKMRAFLKGLVAEGRRVAAVEVPRIIDIDRPSDLQTANAWLAARER